MKRIIGLFLVFVFFIGWTGSSFATDTFGVTAIDNRLLQIDSVAYGNNMRIMVEKESERYFYSMNSSQEHIPLQLGDGVYTVRLLKNIEGNRFQVMGTSEMKVLEWNKDVFLSSSQPVYWEDQIVMEQLAASLFEGVEGDYQKMIVAYDYLVNNIRYDYNKINIIQDSYVPSIDATITSGDGICYDYSALFAGLLRSQGVPSKLVKGYKIGLEEYHAWNEVLIDGTWILIDTTFDAAYYQRGLSVEMVKAESEYQKVREY